MQKPSNRIERLRRAVNQYAVLAERDGPDSIYHALRDSTHDRLMHALHEYRGEVSGEITHMTHVIVGDHDPEPRHGYGAEYKSFGAQYGSFGADYQ